MTIRSVPGATPASHAQPSRSLNRASTAAATHAEDMPAGTEPPGVGGRPNPGVDRVRLAAVIGACLFVGGFWSAIGLMLAGLLLGACLFALPLAIACGVWVAERWWPNAGDKLAAFLDTETRDERRVRTELYRPGSQVERHCSKPGCKSVSTGGGHGLCEMHLDQWLDERYERSWDDPDLYGP